MPRPSNTKERRTQIAKGLIQVMAQKGYDAASIGQIAKAAELTQGLVHYHFKNKQEILVAALKELSNRHVAALKERLDGTENDPCKKLVAFVNFHLKLGSNADPEALACWIVLSGEALRQELIKEKHQQVITNLASHLSSIIEQGMEQGLFNCNDANSASSALIATIQGYFVLAATARELIPKGSAASSTIMMAQGLLNPSRSLLDGGVS